VSHFDPTRCAEIGRDYRISNGGVLVEDEAMRCAGCGFRTTLVGSPVFAWVRRLTETEPLHVEVCEICHAAAGLFSPPSGV
jgi:hypothetical protein